MKFFIFKESCDSAETGPVYPQIQGWKAEYDEEKSNSYYSYYQDAKMGSFPTFSPDLDSLVIHQSAKLTDIVSSIISIGFIISKKLKLLFEHCHLPPHRYYPAKILWRGVQIEEYYFMHIISDYTDYIDYTKSDFITCGFSNANPTPIEITSKGNFLEIVELLRYDVTIKKLPYRLIKANKINLIPKFDETLDFFQIGRFDINYYVSERLKDVLGKSCLTGYQIDDQDRLVKGS